MEPYDELISARRDIADEESRIDSKRQVLIDKVVAYAKEFNTWCKNFESEKGKGYCYFPSEVTDVKLSIVEKCHNHWNLANRLFGPLPFDAFEREKEWLHIDVTYYSYDDGYDNGIDWYIPLQWFTAPHIVQGNLILTLDGAKSAIDLAEQKRKIDVGLAEQLLIENGLEHLTVS